MNNHHGRNVYFMGNPSPPYLIDICEKKLGQGATVMCIDLKVNTEQRRGIMCGMDFSLVLKREMRSTRVNSLKGQDQSEGELMPAQSGDSWRHGEI
ncbi:unnamed protein product [Allacma fusca]|uniref:Uncharacterized protein n=1 Tax=Allacma fusca TaxID=39272 RepID=A0A8J2NUE1_9HEXA|nr:unnamed protein product [Allacma fusca]